MENEQAHLIQVGCYPTEQRLAAKQRAKDGILPKRKKKQVEQHFDDCGEDLTPICDKDPKLSMFTDGYSSDEEDNIGHKILSSWVTHGFQCSESDLPPSTHPGMVIAVDFEEAYPILINRPYGVEIVEFCGGLGLTTQMAVKRQLSTGHNFELLTGCDLTDTSTQRKVLSYLSIAKPLVIVMAPRCDPFGPLGRWNRVKDGTAATKSPRLLQSSAAELLSIKSAKKDISYVNNLNHQPSSKRSPGRGYCNIKVLSKLFSTSAVLSSTSMASCARKPPSWWPVHEPFWNLLRA